MEVVISGASGLIGSALSESLHSDGHRAIAMVRRTPKRGADEIAWNPKTAWIDAASLNGVDAVVHLAGAGIGDRRWTESRKAVLRASRIDGTRVLAGTLAGLDRPPPVFVCGSAVGYYGSRGDEILTEVSTPGTGFLAQLVKDWEAAAAPAIGAGIRTPLARSGVVLTGTGGSLHRQLPLFKVGLGGRFGPGTQWLAWISLRDQVRAIEYLLTADIDGPVNMVSPNPVTNLEFTKTLGQVLGRPTMLPVPLFGPRLLFGAEMVTEMILASQRARPDVLSTNGFSFVDAELGAALPDMVAA